VTDERALVPGIARHLGLAEIANDWSGVDPVLPLLDRMRADGAIAIIKLDGERTGPDDGGQYTILASGGPLKGEFLRADTVTLEEGLARVIVGYARKCWQFEAPDVGSTIVERTMGPDDILFGTGGPSAPTSWDESIMRTVADHLVQQMTRALGQPLQLVDDDGVYMDDGFSVDFRTADEAASALTLRFRGTIGGEMMQGAFTVTAWLFFYLENTRLHLEVPGENLWMSYVETEQGGIWQSQGWEYGEHGENDAFERFDEE
jgi:hypothetical protein